MAMNIQELEQTRSDIYPTKYMILKSPEFSLIGKFKVLLFRVKIIVSYPEHVVSFREKSIDHADKR